MKDFASRTPAAKAAEPATSKGAALVDNRANTVAQLKMQAAIAASPRQIAQRQQAPVQLAAPRPNRTGLPDKLKAGVESLSGHSLDDVKVHYNSAKPAQLQAHAYAQGTDIHLGPGQEKHLPHEAWHVVQQKQGRVKPTMLINNIGINDTNALEYEANNMGSKSEQLTNDKANIKSEVVIHNPIVQRVVKVANVKQVFGALWLEIQENPTFTVLHLSSSQVEAARVRLKKWVEAPAKSLLPKRKSENRNYDNLNHLINSLIGEINSKEIKKIEKKQAEVIFDEAIFRIRVNSAMQKLKLSYTDVIRALPVDKKKGRYQHFYGKIFKDNNLDSAVSRWVPGESLLSTITLILDLSLAIKEHAVQRLELANRVSNILPNHLSQARMHRNHWNGNEGADWTKKARMNNLPLSAGPSATTGQTMNVLRAAPHVANGAIVSKEEMIAVAEAAFAFWAIKAYKHKSGIHTRTEVMSVLDYHLSLQQAEQAPQAMH